MKKMLIVAVLLLLTAAATYLASCNNNSPAVTAEDKAKDSLAKVIERGSYLANNVAACIHCHSKRDFTQYAGPNTPGSEGGGGDVFDHNILDAIPGTLYGKNITPDAETGIGSWTDEQIIRAITQGISKNGDTLFPLMPYANFNRMAKDDLLSIIAYLKTLKPIKNKVPDRRLMIPASMAYPAPFLQPSTDGNTRPAETDLVKYGEYITTMADCGTCHTAFVKGQPDMSKAFGGGNIFHIGETKVTSANITPDSTGIGAWTEEMFLKKFTMYREDKAHNYNPGNKNNVMPLVSYAGMTDSDLKAIYAYLRTVKPVSNKVEKYPQ